MARGLNELSPAGLEAFISAGVKRELLMILPISDIRRAQQISEKDSQELEKGSRVTKGAVSLTEGPALRPWDRRYRWVPFMDEAELVKAERAARQSSRRKRGRASK